MSICKRCLAALQRQKAQEAEQNVISSQQPAGKLYFGSGARTCTRKSKFSLVTILVFILNFACGPCTADMSTASTPCLQQIVAVGLCCSWLPKGDDLSHSAMSVSCMHYHIIVVHELPQTYSSCSRSFSSI